MTTGHNAIFNQLNGDGLSVYTINLIAYNIRSILHANVYLDPTVFTNLISEISELEVFNIEYSFVEKKFDLKVKKTNIKKNYGSESNTHEFYINLLKPIFYKFFMKHRMVAISLVGEKDFNYMLNNYMMLLFDIILVGDNSIVVIKL